MNSFATLYQQKQQLLSQENAPRAINAAAQMGICEAQFVALSEGETVTRLDTKNMESLFQSLESLGELMALTRNEQVVMEHHGTYSHPKFVHGNIIINQPEIDLRLRVSQWSFAFAVNEKGRHSLQFFNAYGVAVHKIYATKQTDMSAYQALVSHFALPTDRTPLIIATPPEETVENEKSPTIDTQALRQAWRQIDNAHQVNTTLEQFGLTRTQAYPYLGEDAQALQNDALKNFLIQASKTHLPLLIFVPNGQATQIHNGTFQKLLETGPWFNVLDPRFNLHAQLSGLHQGWLIKKYLTTDANSEQTEITWSLEFFNAKGESVMMIYLHPDARQDETLLSLWQTLALSLVA